MVSSDPFTVDNVPFGIISIAEDPRRKPATIIGDTVIDLSKLESEGFFNDIAGYPTAQQPFQSEVLNDFANLPKSVRKAVRLAIQDGWKNGKIRNYEALLPQDRVQHHVPMRIINFSDYVSSRGHFENLQNMMNTPEELRCPMLHMPMGYYGNARNIFVSGTPVHRFTGLVAGQFQKEAGATSGSTERFDFELELGVFLSGSNNYGSGISTAAADDHVFGFVLLNDWSARDIQRAESGGPTGPFLGKSACVTISPWIVTLDALERARVERQLQPAVPLVPHLLDGSEQPCLDIRCSAYLSVEERPGLELRVCDTKYSEMYWTHQQLIAHQTFNGSVVGTGDLIGTGTMSLYQSDDMGRCCLSERTYNGTKPLDIGEGTTRSWLQDGDRVRLEAWVYDTSTGAKLFGFGDCVGVVSPPV